jgi:hypothetical protein
MPPPSTDSTLAEIARPLPTFPTGPLSAATPNPRGLVASMLTKVATTPAPLDWVPGAATAASGGRIVWAKDFASGYQDAVALRKGMVVVFGETGQPIYEKLLASFAAPELAAMADEAIWIRSDPTKEVMAKNVCTVLGIERLPVVAVLDPDPDIISEEMMIGGDGEPAKLARDLDVPLKRANGRLPRVPTMKPR